MIDSKELGYVQLTESDPSVSNRSVAIENGVPPTTARRWINGLER